MPDYNAFSGPPWNHWVSGGPDPLFTMSNSPDLRLKTGENFILDRFIYRSREMVEPDGIEPTTSCLQSTRSTN
jgi:hypothetical protein